MEVTSETYSMVSKRMAGWDNKETGLLTTLAIMETENGFDQEAFLKSFAEALYGNGILRSDDPKEVFLLDAAMLKGNHHRNYHMANLVDAMGVMYYTRENYSRTHLLVGGNGNGDSL